MSKRTSKFSVEEIKFLLENVQKHINIVECKRTDRTTSKAKARVWAAIAKEINSKCGTFRTRDNIRTKYNNLKKVARIKRKRNISCTGEEPKMSALPSVNQIDNAVLRICQEEKQSESESQTMWDDDASDENNEEKFKIFHRDSNDSSEMDKDETEELPNWGQYTPNKLKSPPHPVLIRQNTTEDRWADLVAAKLVKVQSEISLIISQKEVSEMQMQKLRLEIEHMKEKHEIEMQILKKQKDSSLSTAQ